MASFLPFWAVTGKSGHGLSQDPDPADGMGAMTHTPRISPCRPLTVVLLGLAFVSCSAFDYTADFSNNELFFVDVPFQTKAPGDRQVFVAPLQDHRSGDGMPLHERGFPIRYGNDDFWVRPVPEMFAEVLARHLANSELFPEVTNQASADCVILKPSLMSFTVGAREAMAGCRSFAEVGLRIEVFGPADQGGERPLWHDQVYGNQQVSEVSVKPVSPYRLIGRALQVTISRTLVGIDGSNVGRSHVPVAAVAAMSKAGPEGGQPVPAHKD